jgi:hypothetical protein
MVSEHREGRIVTEQSYRILWSQVVLQAKDDLDQEPRGSILFDQATAFFVSRGDWAESRAIIADCLQMHPDDLYRCGKRWIAERRTRDGLPSEAPPAPRPNQPVLMPSLVALPSSNPPRRKGGREKPSRSTNPFAQYRLASSS